MPESLNVIALISGGKDSLYSIAHCVENGHKVVALANLYPHAPAPDVDPHESGDDVVIAEDEEEGADLDSFMYQTVGYSIIPLYASALDLPLYRARLTGSATQTGRYYDPSLSAALQDETEDLLGLLQRIMLKHPSANAVSSGAILSTYQRTRIESVASRLRLISLAYLWQYPALPAPTGRGESLTGLLDDMEAAGCDARIIKIASGGIKASLLWANVADARTKSKILAGLTPFFDDHEFWLRAAVLGEGGEYESLALDGPSQVWKKRIIIHHEQNRVIGDEGGASHIKFGRAEIVEKEISKLPEATNIVRTPNMFDTRFTAVRERLQGNVNNTDLMSDKDQQSPTDLQSQPSIRLRLRASHSCTSRHVALVNITSHEDGRGVASQSVGAQMDQIVLNLQSLFTSISKIHNVYPPLDSSSMVSTTLLLSSISSFSTVNPIYASVFASGLPNPPARVTIACPLPEGVKVSLSIIFDLGQRDLRRGLHVQSRSYWAPANIGPYSQAVTVPLTASISDQDGATIHDAGLMETIHVAGQIPLVPPTMQILKDGLLHQAVLALQHLWRVGQEREIDVWTWGVAFLEANQTSTTDPRTARERIKLAARVWEEAHLAPTHAPPSESTDAEDEQPAVDLWQVRNNRFGGFPSSAVPMTVGEHLHILPNPSVYRTAHKTNSAAIWTPPFVAAEIISLPHNAPIEWWSVGLAHLPKSPLTKPIVETSHQNHEWGVAACTRLLADSPEDGTRHEVGFIFCSFYRTAAVQSVSSITQVLGSVLDDTSFGTETGTEFEIVHGTAFVSTSESTSESTELCDGITAHLPGVTIIPCHRVWIRPNADLKPDEMVECPVVLLLRADRMISSS